MHLLGDQIIALLILEELVHLDDVGMVLHSYEILVSSIGTKSGIECLGYPD